MDTHAEFSSFPQLFFSVTGGRFWQEMLVNNGTTIPGLQQQFVSGTNYIKAKNEQTKVTKPPCIPKFQESMRATLTAIKGLLFSPLNDGSKWQGEKSRWMQKCTHLCRAFK